MSMEPTEILPTSRAMTPERTEQQTDQQQQLASELSLRRTRPPAEVQGYDFEKFLGSGAYGEVWVALDRNTGRRVAVKFYIHRGGLDWRLLSREVEKLVLLSADRYIVQVLDVGWDANPPYYVMEFIENGSLDEFLKRQGRLPLEDAVEMFRGVATGLLHAHNKGVLHCDVKPANVLLDQDHKPRLADFGQSRLSHEQSPALGTLFYMAPEQADLHALPDARWDVYALGVLLYLMLTGELPYRDESTITKINSATGLEERLACYRGAIRNSPRPTQHRHTRGVDRALAEVIDKCLAVSPKQRFPNVQSVLEALDARQRARARRPLVTLGILGPALLLAVMALFGWRGYTRAMGVSDKAVMERAQDSDLFAAQFVSSGVANELERYHRGVEELAQNPEFIKQFQATINAPELAGMLTQLKDLCGASSVTPEQLGIDPERYAELEKLRGEYERHPARQALQQYMDGLFQDERKPKADSWISVNADGVHVASAFDSPPSRSPIGRNYAYRSYFQNGDQDKRPGFVPGEEDRLAATHLSGVFLSTATGAWKVAISTPIHDEKGKYLGVLGLTVEMGGFLREFENTESRYAVLVDARDGPFKGVILQHPLYEEFVKRGSPLPGRFSDKEHRVPLNGGAATDVEFTAQYHDPLGEDEAGGEFAGPWIMAKAPVKLRRGAKDAQGEPTLKPTGWVVLVQEDYNAATEPVHNLGQRLVREGMTALAAVAVTIAALWFFVVRGMGSSNSAAARRPSPNSERTPRPDKTTLDANA